MKREYYDEEMMVKEAITSQKTDQEIGMPDIEAELKRVKQLADNNEQLADNNEQLADNNEQLAVNNGVFGIIMWRRVAAVLIIVISITGLSWAFVYYQDHKAESNVTEQPTQLTVNNEPLTENAVAQDTTIVQASEQLTLSYDKASLEQIIVDLSTYYHLDKPVFADQMAARKYMMHVTFNQKESVENAIELLNNFGSVHVTLADNKLTVDK